MVKTALLRVFRIAKPKKIDLEDIDKPGEILGMNTGRGPQVMKAAVLLDPDFLKHTSTDICKHHPSQTKHTQIPPKL